MIQNHLFQVLTNLAMEPAGSTDSESVRDEKVKVLKAIPPLEEKDLLRGQFIGYRNEKDVAPDSKVETYAASDWRLIQNAGKASPSISEPGNVCPSPILKSWSGSVGPRPCIKTSI